MTPRCRPSSERAAAGSTLEAAFCPSCGTRRPESARFCPSCGFDFTTLALVPSGDERAEPSGDAGVPAGRPVPIPNAAPNVTPSSTPTPILSARLARERPLRSRPGGSTSAAKAPGSQAAVEAGPRSPRYRAGQVVGTAILVVLVAVIAYVTFSTAARLGDPGPSASSAGDSGRAATPCERAVANVVDHPEQAIAECTSQAEIDAAYRTVFLEPPQWGRELSDACAANPALATRPLCVATAPPEPTPTEPTPSEPSPAGPSSSP